jgi:hypothetical protein
MDTTIRELDSRSSDGIDVRLLWSPHTEQVWIDVRDHRLGGSFRLEVERSEALAAFRHPYAHAIPRDAERALAA